MPPFPVSLRLPIFLRFIRVLAHVSLVMTHAALKWFHSFGLSNGANPFDSSIGHNLLEAARRDKPASRELKQRQRRRQRERHEFAYLVVKNNSFARPARAFFTFVHFVAVVSKTTT